MIGTVEIYSDFGTDEQKLVHKEENLIVNGAGEAICDMLSLPSGIGAAKSGLLDSSNFTIQALSIGKSSEAYKHNAHFYPFDISSHYVARPSAEFQYFSGLPEFATYVSAVKEDNVIRAVSLVNENIDSTTSSYDPKRNPGTSPNPNDKLLEPDTYTAIDSTSGQSHYMKNGVMQGRAHAYGHNLNKIRSRTNKNLLSFTESPTKDPDFVAGDEKYWSSGTGMSSIELRGRHTGPYYGTSSFLVSAANNDQLTFLVPPIRTAFHGNVDHTFSMYVKIPASGMDTSGTVSSLVLNIRNNTSGRNHQSIFSYYDEEHQVLGAPSATISTLGPIIINSRGATPDITIASGADSSAGWYRFEVALAGLGEHGGVFAEYGDQVKVSCKFLGMGGNNIPLEMYGWQLEERFGSSPYQKVEGINPTMNEGGIDGDLFLGCYPHTSGTPFAILSDLSSITYLSSNVLISGTYPNSTTDNFFNGSSVRSMDENGFIKAYAPSSTTGDYPLYPSGIKNPVSGVIVSATSDFSTIGEVMYICTISSGDLGTANMYGGLFKFGLWTIDLKETLSDRDHEGNYKIPPDFPLKFTAGYNRLVYKLFAEKSFSKNIAAIKDSATNIPGCFSYSDLTLIWRLKFI